MVKGAVRLGGLLPDFPSALQPISEGVKQREHSCGGYCWGAPAHRGLPRDRRSQRFHGDYRRLCGAYGLPLLLQIHGWGNGANSLPHAPNDSRYGRRRDSLRRRPTHLLRLLGTHVHKHLHPSGFQGKAARIPRGRL